MKKLKSFLGYLLITTALFAQTTPTPNPDVTETVFVNTKVTLQVTADGTSPITFNWFKNGVAYGTPGSSLVFNSIQASDAGTYKVTATNLAGSADSNSAIIIVVTPVAPSNVRITIIKG
jgi:hypothetical protein